MNIRSLLLAPPPAPLADGALLLARAGVAASLFAVHGWEKVSGFQSMIDRYHMDPLHIGAYPSLAFATVSDGICTLLVILGLFSRAATTVILVNLTVVFFVMQDALGIFAKLDPTNPMLRAPRGEHSELVLIYLLFFLVLLVFGPGRYSLDYRIFGRKTV